MYGAILGDIIGSPYEFDRGNKTKDFPLFSRYSEFTDDTVMTIAVADAFLPVQPEMEDDAIRQAFNVIPRDNTAFLPRVMSRKKQVIPMLSDLWG